MKKLLKYLKGYTKECILGPLFKLLEASFELMIPLVVARIVDTGIAGGDSAGVWKLCLLMVVLGVVGFICAVTAQYFAARAAVGFATRLRHYVMAHILNLSYSQLDSLGTATMVTRMTLDVNQVQNGVNLTLRLLLRSPFVVFGAMIMAFTIDPSAAMVFLGLIPVLCIIVFGIMLITIPMHRRVQSAMDGVTSTVRQNLTGVRVLRAFRREKAEVEKYEEETGELYARQLSAGRISALMNPVTFAAVNLAVVLLIRVGALRVDGGLLTQGLVIALYNYMGQILVELIKMANLIITMTRAAACGKRISAILDIVPEEQERSGVPAKLQGRVELRNATLTYPGAAAPALEDISLTAEPGRTIGVIGGTGSGKTSLVNLIPAFYPGTSGRVLLDGVDAGDYEPAQLRSQIGVVPQRSVLFQGTIRDNLRWGKENATDAQLWEALELAQAREFVAEKEGGLDAPVAQGGTNFSGGQRQRLAIARALVRHPAILILDDSASALDYATDASLRMAIRAMADPPTTFIVSQRAASLLYADEILVLEDGRLAGRGTHESLLQSCGVYQEIYYSQFPKEDAHHE